MSVDDQAFTQEPLLKAAANLTCDEVRRLLDLGADISVSVSAQVYLDQGKTALHIASDYGRPATCALLIERGLPVDVRTTQTKRTPLHDAASSGRASVVQVLLAAGADPSAKDAYGTTPLDVASLRGYPGVFKLLSLAVEHQGRQKQMPSFFPLTDAGKAAAFADAKAKARTMGRDFFVSASSHAPMTEGVAVCDRLVFPGLVATAEATLQGEDGETTREVRVRELAGSHIAYVAEADGAPEAILDIDRRFPTRDEAIQAAVWIADFEELPLGESEFKRASEMGLLAQSRERSDMRMGS